MNMADILAVGAHSDDIEIGMAGSLLNWSGQGKTIVLCDLTRAERSSNGTPENRLLEAEKAAALLSADKRINLGMPDRNIQLNEENVNALVSVIRKVKPKAVFAPYYIDRHPDHGNASKLIKEAVFSAGIRKILPEDAPHKAKLYYYMINGVHKPDFVINISSQIVRKQEVLMAYKSQFTPLDGVETPLTDQYIESVIARDKVFGKEAGVSYAEGFISPFPLILNREMLGD
ncbi:bacillithiol biosynthesis deacetylase BshB1 [Jeotgalibacillus sp. R-1-5s-1]|uniref:bacillithiol biosynthesis deacetylase BshB1 n=1 Tax=Jeotgalibacillus sp. R-1-5s-1 TaxID=2555897 RepID=UPI00106D76E1|nr:bacillithiol biosynthesis deacetylase BshB1 [Jeotgalibacillus sp. R-1-5s-1]TFE03699.1 bacillithiol biosynthesis deacetylase BshB1 [Jeotgalibacillus sp. R-1-5s-1]